MNWFLNKETKAKDSFFDSLALYIGRCTYYTCLAMVQWLAMSSVLTQKLWGGVPPWVSASPSSYLRSLSSDLNVTSCDLHIFKLSIFTSSVFNLLIFPILHFKQQYTFLPMSISRVIIKQYFWKAQYETWWTMMIFEKLWNMLTTPL